MIVANNASALDVKAKLFRGFADPSRLAILEALREGTLSVGEIVEVTGLGQSNTSNHLGCLHDCGLVSREQRGRYVYYRLSDDRVGALLGATDELLLDVTRGVYECIRYARPDAGDTEAGRGTG
jgi:DNA-binding transcriptional ArsR family regulator